MLQLGAGLKLLLPQKYAGRVLAGISVALCGMPDLFWGFDHAGTQFEIISPLPNLEGYVFF